MRVVKGLVYRKQAREIIAAQLFFVFFLTFFVGLSWGVSEGKSFLLGGSLAPLANAYFYIRVFSHFGARAAKKIVSAFYRGEAIKVALTATAFGVLFQARWGLLPLWLLVGYITAQVIFALAASGLHRWVCRYVGMMAR